MIVLTVALLGFAIADLVVWSLDAVGAKRRAFAAVLVALACGGIAALTGQKALTAIVVLGVGSLASVSAWLWLSRREGQAPWAPLAFMTIVIAGAFALSGSFAASSGPLDAWYRDLPFPFVARVPLDQSLMAVAAALFLVASANPVVRLVLAASGTSLTGESTLKGGRVIGSMERLFVMAMVISGSVVAAAALIAAKGLLRLPEIRTNAQRKGGQDDEVTEYFLIGTFASLLLAAVFGGVVAAAG